MKKADVIEVLLNILIIVISLIIIYMLIMLLLGESPGAIEIIGSLVGLLVVNEFKTAYLNGKFHGEFREFKRNVTESFIKIREDIKELKHY